MEMNKAMRDLLTAIEKKTNEAKAETDKEKKATLVEEAKALQAQYETEKALFDCQNTVAEANANEPVKGKTATGGAGEETERAKFFKAAREGFPKRKTGSGVSNETTGAEGGYTVPADIVAKVEKFREAHSHLSKRVRRVPVTTPSGERTFVSRATHTAFSEVGEGGKIGRKAGPAFQRLAYAIKKYGGYTVATNELLEDSDENIEAFLVEWLGNAKVATEDALTLAQVETKEAVALDGLDGIKYAVNVLLGQAFADTSVVYTNDDGLNYLDTLKDEEGRDLITPDPAGSSLRDKRLYIGGRYIPLDVSPNVDLPSKEVKTTQNGEQVLTAYKYPFIIGDLDEGIADFHRSDLSVKASDTAVVGSDEDLLNAFEEDLTLLRGLFRADFKVRDAAAFVNGYIQVSVNP